MKKILITGAASGIGRAVKNHFLSAGWIVGVLDRNSSDELRHINEHRYVGDVRDDSFISDSIKAFYGVEGSWELVFCNVATASAGHFQSIPWDEHEAMIDTNLRSTVFLIYNCIKLLKNSQAPAILISSSVATNHGVPMMATYSATKAAIVGLVEALSLELEKKNIRCVYINLGRFSTPMAKKVELHFEGNNGTKKYSLPKIYDWISKSQSPEIVGRIIEQFYNSGSKRNIHLPWTAKYHFCFSRLVPMIHRLILRINMAQVVKQGNNKK